MHKITIIVYSDKELDDIHGVSKELLHNEELNWLCAVHDRYGYLHHFGTRVQAMGIKVEKAKEKRVDITDISDMD